MGSYTLGTINPQATTFIKANATCVVAVMGSQCSLEIDLRGEQ